MKVMRAAIGILVLLVAGCSSHGDGQVDGPVLRSGGGAGDRMTAIVAGRLGFKNGCLLLGRGPVVWPKSTSWNADRQSLTLPSGDVGQVGDKLTGGGGYLQVTAIADLFGDDVADAARACLGATGEVAVFNPGSDVEVET